jgi:serine/threonine-protein kinase
MDAHPMRAELRRYVTQDRSLGPDRLNQIEMHVEKCPVCQDVLDQLTVDDVPPGTTMPLLPGYRMYKLLGCGAFGEVWLAQDLNLLKVVAVKTLKVGADPQRREQALEILRREARLLADVDHPNVVGVYAWLIVHDHHYLVMQYVSGGSLEDLLKSERALDWQRAARYVADVGEGLLEVHARGIVHRDVKPANILWDPRRDEALLTDFGVGVRLDDQPTVGGSIPYMAPEAFDGLVLPSLDVYSLAATFFHLVTGSAPFPGSRIADLQEQILRGLPDPDPRCAGLPEPLERIIRNGLAADPGRRPTLNDFVVALRGELNRLIIDTLTMPSSSAAGGSTTEPAPGAATSSPPAGTGLASPAPVGLRLVVSRQDGLGRFQAVATTDPRPAAATRDMRRVPPAPGQARVRTGERVRVDVVADRDGYVTVFNVGPTGQLNLLLPDDPAQLAAPWPIAAHRPAQVVDVELTTPAGRERLVAVWTRRPLPLRLEQLASLVEGGDLPGSRPYRATRDMRRVQQSVRHLKPDDWHAVVLELDHEP